MAMILLFNVTGKRRASLIVCCKTSKRVKICKWHGHTIEVHHTTPFFFLEVLLNLGAFITRPCLNTQKMENKKKGEKNETAIQVCTKYLDRPER